MDFKRRTPDKIASTPSKGEFIGNTFGQNSPDNNVKIPVGSLAKLNREHSKKEFEKNKNHYTFLDDKGVKAFEILRAG